MAGNIARFDTDGLWVGNNQLTTSGGDVTIGKNLFVTGDLIMYGAMRGTSEETYTVFNSRPPGNIDIPFTQSSTFYTDATITNIAINFLLGDNVPVNNSVYFTIILTNTAVANVISSVTVNGTYAGVSLRWSGGTTPTGNANAFDYYNFQILRTSDTYYVFAATTKF
jgi:hypothetical protein